MYIFMPVFTGPLANMRQEVHVNGRRWRNVECLDTENMSGIVPGSCLLRFPYEYYGGQPVEDNDLIEVWIEPYYLKAPIFRGHVVRWTGNKNGEVFVTAEDGRGHLDDDVFYSNYNERDHFTGTVDKKFSTYEILNEGFWQYVKHQEGNGNYENLELSLRSFPNAYAGEQSLFGIPHGVGIQQVIEDVGGAAWRMALQHYRTFSQLQPFKIGEQGKPTTRTTRGTDPNVHFSTQPDGFATVNEIRQSRDARNVTNRLRIYSKNRKVEILATLTEHWDQSIEAKVLANRDKYTREKIGGNDNPNYLERANDVGRVYLIPEVDDSWTSAPLDRSQGYERRPRIFNDLVQLDPEEDDEKTKARPFLLYKYADDAAGDANWRYSDAGFTIRDDAFVHISDPISREISYVVDDAKGSNGAGMDDGDATTCRYKDNSIDWNVLLGTPSAGDLLYCLLGTSRIPRLVKGVASFDDGNGETNNVLLLNAWNLDEGTDDFIDAPSNWIIFEGYSPSEHFAASGGLWATDPYTSIANIYIPGGTLSSMTPGEHVGKMLVEGDTYYNDLPERTYASHIIIANTATTLTVSPAASATVRSSGA